MPSSRAATVTLGWDANTDGVTATYVLYKVIGNLTNTVMSVAHPTVTATLTREAPGSSANYYLTAKSAAGLESGPSNIVTDNVPVTPPPLALPSAVVNLTAAVSVAGGTVTQTLSWASNPAAEQVTAYTVRRFDEGGNMVQASSTTGTSFTMTFGTATFRTDVSAVNGAGASPARSVSVTRPRAPFGARITVTN